MIVGVVNDSDDVFTVGDVWCVFGLWVGQEVKMTVLVYMYIPDDMVVIVGNIQWCVML